MRAGSVQADTEREARESFNIEEYVMKRFHVHVAVENAREALTV